ncbi:MAG TPA: endonuclease domain-containing protein [Isosphaeraceae bacterium]|nr:endonuclease domain-containing protein [Isosphaeraceae bacterium]
MYHELARELRKNMTDTERLLWSKLRGKQFGGFKFRKQSPIGQFIVDFVCFDRKVVIELDGGQHAISVEDDKKRSEWLKSQGFQVIRFWNHEFIEDSDMVMEAIWLALQRPPTLALPHEGGGNFKGGSYVESPGSGELPSRGPKDSGQIPSGPTKTNSTKDPIE